MKKNGKWHHTLIALAVLVPMSAVAVDMKPLTIPEAREKAESTVKSLIVLEKKFIANTRAGVSARQMNKDVSKPLFDLLDEWPTSYVEDDDAQHHFLSCRDSIRNLQSLVSSVTKPTKNAATNEKNFESALALYEESGQKCQAVMKMTDAELAAIDKQKREDKCTKKTVIYNVGKGEMVEQPKPDYCTKS